MPPKPRFNHDEIVNAAFAIVRREGWEGLSARSIAKELNASTGPIYSYLESMSAIEIEVVKKALEMIYGYIITPRTGDKWIDHGIGYVLFAKEEKHLFRCINDEKHSRMTKDFTRATFDALSQELTDYEPFQGLDEDTRLKIRASRWFFIHGLASLINNEWYEMDEAQNVIMRDEKRVPIEELVRKTTTAILKGHRGKDD